MGTHGVVAAGHYLAAQIGLEVLGRRGNAIDAGVASAFALTLVKPHESGLGGECPILVCEPARSGGPNPFVISGQGGAPRRATITAVRELGLSAMPGTGPLAATVPSTFGSLVTALIVSGHLGLRETLGPSVEVARDGYPLYPALREVVVRHEDRLRHAWPTSAEIYLDDRGVPPIGTLVRHEGWARTMSAILDVEARHRRRGRVAALEACLDTFYRGPVAESIAAFVAGSPCVEIDSGRVLPGLLDSDDLAAHRPQVEQPVAFPFRGLEVFKCPPWSQGPVFLQQLALLEGFDLASMGHNTPAYIHTVVEAAKLAFADREAFYGDPGFVNVPLEDLLSPDYNRERRALIDPKRASAVLRSGLGARPLAHATMRPGSDHGDTTHVDVIDAQGNMFSATPSGGWLQSSPVVPALGFPLGTRGQQFSLEPGHPNALAPGKRPRTTLSPSLVLRDGAPWMVFGTEGGDNQDQWTLQFLLNIVEFGMDLQAAADAPLFHTTHFPSSFFPHDASPLGLVVEGRISDETRKALTRLGHEITVAGDWSSGQVTGVRYSAESGLIEGAASPRSLAAYAVGR
jgi:gamma-glutamyltranspeptidase/glutathione hydrolase